MRPARRQREAAPATAQAPAPITPSQSRLSVPRPGRAAEAAAALPARIRAGTGHRPLALLMLDPISGGRVGEVHPHLVEPTATSSRTPPRPRSRRRDRSWMSPLARTPRMSTARIVPTMPATPTGQAGSAEHDRRDDRQLKAEAGVDRGAADLGQQDETGEAGREGCRQDEGDEDVALRPDAGQSSGGRDWRRWRTSSARRWCTGA